MFGGSLLVKNELWTPVKLFRAGEFGFWYDIHPDYLYQDSTGTIPAVVNQPVGLVLDRSGRNQHGTQANNALRPTLRQSGGLYYLDQSVLGSHINFGTFTVPSQVHYAVGFNINGDQAGMLLVRDSSYWSWAYQNGNTSNLIAVDTKRSIHVNGVDLTDSINARNDLYQAIATGNRVGVFAFNGLVASLFSWNSGYYPAASVFSSQSHLYSIVFRDRMTDPERILLEEYVASKTGVIF